MASIESDSDNLASLLLLQLTLKHGERRDAYNFITFCDLSLSPRFWVSLDTEEAVRSQELGGAWNVTWSDNEGGHPENCDCDT